MSKINIYECPNGHKYLLSNVCPFCSAMNNTMPDETNEWFLRIYNEIKGKSTEKIEEFYNKYIPNEEPDKPLINVNDKFF